MDSVKDVSENSETKSTQKDYSFRTRLLVADIFVPVSAYFAFLGGTPFLIFVTALVCVAAWEFWRIFKRGGYSPSLVILILGCASVVIMRYSFELAHIEIWLGLLVLISMVFHTLQQQRGDGKAASNLAITIFGVIYIGFLASYAISVRFLDHGLLWTLLIFPIISIADAGGYIFGRLFGKHKMFPVVSPKKSWEGYIGGILVGGLGGWGLASLWHIASPAVLPIHGLILGFIISMLAPFGDFGESMIKRQFNVKDSSNILPGHGGILDRVDSSLWAAFLGYYLILLIK